MEKTDFEKLCQDYGGAAEHALSGRILPAARRCLAENNAGRLPVIWLETNDSGDNNIAFMNTTYPYMHEVLTDMIDLLYSNSLMAAQGGDALEILLAAERRGGFTLVVEGAIPVKADGLYNIVALTPQGPLTALEALRRLGRAAKYIIALGTCASFGGASAAAPNPTGSQSVDKIVGREVIKVSGCPINPDWFVGTLAHLLMYGRPELDEFGRPKLFYGFTVHRHCQRRSYFDNKNFAAKLGDIECMFSLGCVGPRTGSDCPYRQWINHVSWPVKVNTPCIGCTNPDFPDGSSPFFTPLPDKSAASAASGHTGTGKGAENESPADSD